MEYLNKTILKNGQECIIRNGTKSDGKEVLDLFILTHKQSDYLASYADENKSTYEEEADWLQKKTDSPDGIELVAEVNGVIVGLAGIGAVSSGTKFRHRASFGVCVEKSYWGQGIGKALTKACIECAEKAGYSQLELEVVKDNAKAVSLYKQQGFREFGCNSRGFRTRSNEYQELLLMSMELNS